MLNGVEEEYNVKQSFIAVLFHPKLQHNVFQVREADKIAKKIEESKNYVYLEEHDYEILKRCFENINGFSREDLELISRVMESKKIDISEDGGKINE